MKKLYNKKGKVHPSSLPSIADHLVALLPTTILALSATLSPEEKQVLAYLISCSNEYGDVSLYRKGINKKDSNCGSGNDHPPLFQCNCFRCYMSFWARWDASKNRQLIHEIIEAYEEDLLKRKKKKKSAKLKKEKCAKLKKERKDERVVVDDCLRSGEEQSKGSVDMEGNISGLEMKSKEVDVVGIGVGVGVEKGGYMRKFVTFIGERIWSGVWNRG